MVSMPRDRGVTSSSSRPFTSPVSTPAWMAAPMATHSSGLMPLKPSLPVSFFTSVLHGGDTAGAAHQQDLGDVAAAEAGVAHGLAHGAGMVASTRWAVSSLNLARVRVRSRCLGPVASAVI